MLFVISSPSGCGKSTLARHLLGKFRTLKLSVSVTTREKRDGEEEGSDYYFRTIGEYQEMLANNEFLESVEFCGNYYGSLKSEIRSIQEEGLDVLFEIEANGAASIFKHKELDIVSVFILPPKFETLRQRLEGRRANTNDEIRNRVEQARSELLEAQNYDYIIINDDLSDAKAKIEAIYIAEKLKRYREDKIEFAREISRQ